MYEYRCEVVRIVDGDTVIVKVDLGFRLSWEHRFRLAAINAPELATDSGKKSRDRLSELMPVGSSMVVRTKKDRSDKYGRYLGTFIDSEGHEVNQRMVDEGFAERFMD